MPTCEGDLFTIEQTLDEGDSCGSSGFLDSGIS
jgi:hypothetical protein